MMMALAGLFERDLVEWMTCMTYQAASGAGAQNMRELLQQMGEAHLAAKALLDDPASSILDIDREVAGILRDERFPTEHFGVPLAGSLIPWIDKDLGNGMSAARSGRAAPRPTRSSAEARRRQRAIPVESICVRIGAMRCHCQALTIKLRRGSAAAGRSSASSPRRNEWVRLVPNTRDDSIRQLTPAAVTGTLDIPIGRAAQARPWARSTSARSPSATSSCGAPPSRCAGCCASCCGA